MTVQSYLKAGAAAAGMAVVLSGCASLITGGDLIREGEPMARFTFENRSEGQPFDTILISTCQASSYGLDRLPQGVVIRPGQSYSWDVSAGCYDVMAGMTGQGSTPGERITIPPRTHFTLYYDGKGTSRQDVR
ncbi:MAG: hypothetical protein Q8S53_15195 [Brevundimonas sp.]|uniref:hypothetical protein n=1 Tax=Brevundimonas sp. TaxID=1871086 RepID=UPI00273589DC|nr:hypothetical protein [Brevundimonas sp.]MDP3379709.1 hypothetical protein [Brevundimonas sp.]